jgi:hypothetical protein
VLAVVLAAALTGCVAEKRPEHVALTFAWPETLYAQVEQQVEKVDTGKPPVRFTLRYRLDGRRTETEQRVAFSEVTFEPPLPPELEAATRPGFELTHVLDLEGEVARLEGVEE